MSEQSPFTPKKSTNPRHIVSADKPHPNTIRKTIIELILYVEKPLGSSDNRGILMTDHADSNSPYHSIIVIEIVNQLGLRINNSSKGFQIYLGYNKQFRLHHKLIDEKTKRNISGCFNFVQLYYPNDTREAFEIQITVISPPEFNQYNQVCLTVNLIKSTQLDPNTLSVLKDFKLIIDPTAVNNNDNTNTNSNNNTNNNYNTAAEQPQPGDSSKNNNKQ